MVVPLQQFRIRYWAFGLTILSDLNLPCLVVRDDGGQPDLRVRLGRTPDSLRNALFADEHGEASPSELLIRIGGVATFYVQDGREIVVQPDTCADTNRVLLYLTGSVFGALLHQRCLFPLHASAVQVGNDAIAIAGDSGSGKSTLAFSLNQRGYPLLADDVCAVQTSSAAPSVCPGFCRAKLWEDTIRALQLDPGDLDPIDKNAMMSKFELKYKSDISHSSLPLRRIYVLERASPNQAAEITILNEERLQQVVRNTYRYEYLRPMHRLSHHFHWCAQLLKNVTLCRMLVPRGLSRLDDAVDRLERDFECCRAVSTREGSRK